MHCCMWLAPVSGGAGAGASGGGRQICAIWPGPAPIAATAALPHVSLTNRCQGLLDAACLDTIVWLSETQPLHPSVCPVRFCFPITPAVSSFPYHTGGLHAPIAASDTMSLVTICVRPPASPAAHPAPATHILLNLRHPQSMNSMPAHSPLSPRPPRCSRCH